jgi:hypothetical protein
MPLSLAERYGQAVNDPELLSLRSEIALVESRTLELLAALPEQDQDTQSCSWSEIRSLVDQTVRLTESERRRLVQMQQMITAEQAQALMNQVYTIIKEHVHDEATLRAIGTGLQGAAGKPLTGQTERQIIEEVALKYGLDPDALEAEVNGGLI